MKKILVLLDKYHLPKIKKIIIFIPQYGLPNLLHGPLQVSLVFILILILIIIMILITFLFYLNSNCFHSLHIKSVLLLNLNKLIG